MDRFSERQKQINQLRMEASAHYPELWSHMIAEWKKSSPEDRVWLMYSANYLFRTGNIRWAIDPLTLEWRIKGDPRAEVAQDLSDLFLCYSTLAMTFMPPLELVEAEERPMREATERAARAAGRPFISFFVPQKILALACEAGFRKVQHVSAANLTQRYFSGRTDGLRPSSSEELLVAST